MKKIISFFLIFLFITNCTLNKVIKHHGVHFLEKKHKSLLIKKTNKNDIINILGPPSTVSDFDKNLWFYVERISSSSKVTKLGNKQLLANNVLILEFDNRGILEEKFFLNKDDMQNIQFSENITTTNYQRQTFIYDFLSSVRQKINDPLGKRK
ncbi:outer membrane protein assembly factor BamE [Candidatus Pelagibacter sp.]|nr:outer membrane protein assembly factor BamE [Candidatus Pelagibacter sp.]